MTFSESSNLAIDDHSSQNLLINYNKNQKIIKLTSSDNLEMDTAQLLDLNGTNKYSREVSNNKHEINVSSLNNGVYILRVKTNLGIITKKIIIH